MCIYIYAREYRYIHIYIPANVGMYMGVHMSDTS